MRDILKKQHQKIIKKIILNSGDEELGNYRDMWIKEANGFVLIFSLNGRETFDFIKTLVNEINRNNKGDYPIIIVGNKI